MYTEYYNTPLAEEGDLGQLPEIRPINISRVNHINIPSI